MKKLKNILRDLEVPKLENDPFEQELRRDLTNRYFKYKPNYRLRSRFAAAFALILFMFVISTIIHPQIALKLNDLAFKKNQTNTESEDQINEVKHKHKASR